MKAGPGASNEPVNAGPEASNEPVNAGPGASNEPVNAGPGASNERAKVRLGAESAGLVVLLASTWLIVGASLQGASVAVVSAGRTGFAVLGLAALTRWPASRPETRKDEAPPYRWWQLLLLALTGVTAYTVLSTVAISLAGPVLPALILALAPAVVLAAESLTIRVRPALPAIAGTGLAVAGAAIYVVPRLAGSLGRDVALGSLAAVAAMLSMAFYGLYFAAVNRGHRAAMAPRILPVFAVGSIPLLAWAGADLAGGARVGWPVVGMLAVLGLVVYVPAYLLQHRILVSGGAAYAALLGLAVPPLVGLSSAFLGLAGFPTGVQIAGAVVTLAGMALVVRSPRTADRIGTPRPPSGPGRARRSWSSPGSGGS